MTRINGTDRLLTGWGRTAPSGACVAGPMETSQLQEIIAAQPAVASWPGARGAAMATPPRTPEATSWRR